MSFTARREEMDIGIARYESCSNTVELAGYLTIPSPVRHTHTHTQGAKEMRTSPGLP